MPPPPPFPSTAPKTPLTVCDGLRVFNYTRAFVWGSSGALNGVPVFPAALESELPISAARRRNHPGSCRGRVTTRASRHRSCEAACEASGEAVSWAAAVEDAHLHTCHPETGSSSAG